MPNITTNHAITYTNFKTITKLSNLGYHTNIRTVRVPKNADCLDSRASRNNHLKYRIYPNKRPSSRQKKLISAQPRISVHPHPTALPFPLKLKYAPTPYPYSAPLPPTTHTTKWISTNKRLPRRRIFQVLRVFYRNFALLHLLILLLQEPMVVTIDCFVAK